MLPIRIFYPPEWRNSLDAHGPAPSSSDAPQSGMPASRPQEPVSSLPAQACDSAVASAYLHSPSARFFQTSLPQPRENAPLLPAFDSPGYEIHTGGSDAQRTTRANQDTLARRFTIEQLAKICHKGGVEASEVVMQNLERLLEHFTPEDITRMATHIGAAEAMKLVLQNLERLLEHFTPTEIARMAGNFGGSQAIQAVLENLPALLEHFTLGQIARIAGNIGGAQAIRAVLGPDIMKALEKKGFSKEEMASMAGYAGASVTLDLLANQTWESMLSKWEVLDLASRTSASGCIRWFMAYCHTLMIHGCPRDLILWTAAKPQKVRDPLLARYGVSESPMPPYLPKKRRDHGNAAPPAKRQATQAPVETEPSVLPMPLPEPVEVLELEPLNMTQTLCIPTTIQRTVPGLTGDGEAQVAALTLRDMSRATTVTSKQAYDPDLERVFPIRDPSQPHQVHPAYADPLNPSRCTAKVEVVDVLVHAPTELWKLLLHRYPDYPYRQFGRDSFIDAFREACMADLKATLDRKPSPSCGKVAIVTLQESQCGPGEQALVGQYGGVLTDYGPGGQPIFTNGGFVCLFAGARLASSQDDEAYLMPFDPELGPKLLHDYSAQVNKRHTGQLVTWAPCGVQGGGNMAPFLNTAVKRTPEGN